MEFVKGIINRWKVIESAIKGCLKESARHKKGKKSMIGKNNGIERTSTHRIRREWENNERKKSIEIFNREVHDMFRLEGFSQHKDSNLSFKCASSVLVWRYHLFFFVYNNCINSWHRVKNTKKARVLLRSLPLFISVSFFSLVFFSLSLTPKHSLPPTDTDIHLSLHGICSDGWVEGVVVVVVVKYVRFKSQRK